MRYFSAFSGIGGFELGIQYAYETNNNRTLWDGKQLPAETDIRQGANIADSPSELGDGRREYPVCVGYSEIDKYAKQIYQKHFPDHKDYGDITKIKTEDLPDFDLLVGGFPCQAFSIAGKRKGFEDTRGTLFFELARILRTKRPRLFIFENVKGLLSHDNGNTFRTIIATLDELGYDLQWQVLNSKNHGVPQNRERVFIVGNLRGTPRPKVFPFGQTNGTVNEGYAEGNTEISSTLRSRYGNGTGSHIGIKQLRGGSQGERVYDPSGIGVTLASQAGGMGAKTGLYAIPVLTPDRSEKRQNGRRFKKDGEPSFTLTGQDKHGVFDGIKIRRLTPTECARLQGFPDNWHEGISDSQAYKCYGNAVTVNVVRDVAQRIIY